MPLLVDLVAVGVAQQHQLARLGNRQALRVTAARASRRAGRKGYGGSAAAVRHDGVRALDGGVTRGGDDGIGLMSGQVPGAVGDEDSGAQEGQKLSAGIDLTRKDASVAALHAGQGKAGRPRISATAAGDAQQTQSGQDAQSLKSHGFSILQKTIAVNLDDLLRRIKSGPPKLASVTVFP